MDIPGSLINDVRDGRVVLILGAGASIGATDKRGQPPPLGVRLRDLLADKFLASKHKSDPLEFVAELATSETSIGDVQNFIAEQFRDLRPAPFHKIITTFRWRGIATTNYDRLIEDTYAVCSDRLQELVPFLGNSDRIDEKLRSPRHLAYIKLHGCITRTFDVNAPLILTVDQFLRHQKGRSRLYNVLKEWAHENPFVFVGHRLADYDLRSLLADLADEALSRSRFYLVRPNVDGPEVRLWEQKRVTVLSGSFEEFLNELNNSIVKELRPLSLAVSEGHAIEKRFKVREKPSAEVLDFLNNNVEYLYPGLKVAPEKPPRFYRGFDVGWYAIERNLDVRRSLTETVLQDIVIRPEEDRPTSTELYALKAEAGAGKTVFLRRLAWEAARDAEVLCIYVRQGQTVTFDSLTEIARCTAERIFLFWDDAADKSLEIEQLVSESMRKGMRLTVFTGERANAWNMACGNLDRLLTGEYILRYLNHAEIEVLVRLLEQHGCLGKRLGAMTMEDRIREFEDRAGRQILVALHEATLGPPFEEILLNEFNEIQPEQARHLYLTICVLNRLNVQVRAGLIARVHGVPFSEFRQKFFGPLEHVVLTLKDDNVGDYLYRARHPEIAQIVFQQVLKEPTDRFNEYVRLLRDLNLAYASDETAFRQLTRARSLHELFPNHEDADALFAVATERAPEDPYLLEQRANYERIRPNGDLGLALELLSKAREKAPRNDTILHTLGETLRAQSLNADTPIRRERFRKEARVILSTLLNDQHVGQQAFARHTLVKLALDDVHDVIANAHSPERLVDETVREAERILLESIQKCPDEELFFQAEAELGKLIRDDARALRAMEGAFRKNPRDPYIASRLASMYETKGATPRALETLRSALDANRGDKTLNFSYARLLREVDPENQALLLYHFRRGFVKWDDNYEAQFWFARYAFENGTRDDIAETKEVFRRLRKVPMHHNRRVTIRDRITQSSQPVRFTGTITRKEPQHGFVARDGQGDWIFFHIADHGESIWPKLPVHTRVSFEIGFSFAGVRALDIQP